MAVVPYFDLAESVANNLAKHSTDFVVGDDDEIAVDAQNEIAAASDDSIHEMPCDYYGDSDVVVKMAKEEMNGDGWGKSLDVRSFQRTGLFQGKTTEFDGVIPEDGN